MTVFISKSDGKVLSTLPKVTQVVNGMSGPWTQICLKLKKCSVLGCGGRGRRQQEGAGCPWQRLSNPPRQVVAGLRASRAPHRPGITKAGSAQCLQPCHHLGVMAQPLNLAPGAALLAQHLQLCSQPGGWHHPKQTPGRESLVSPWLLCTQPSPLPPTPSTPRFLVPLGPESLRLFIGKKQRMGPWGLEWSGSQIQVPEVWARCGLADRPKQLKRS